MRATTRLRRLARGVKGLVRALADRHHPLLVHVVPMRRCNLACAYCNEYDSVSKPVPLEVMLARIDRIAALGTSMITVSGGEPLMHPDLDAIVARGRGRGMFVTLISNGYYLSPERILGLNAAGLDHLQVSIDNVEPDGVSVKSLRLLEPKLRWLAEHADFTININTVIGSGVRNPEDALTVARRARDLGFMTSLGIIHDGFGQLKPLSEREMRVYRGLKKLGRRRGILRFNPLFQDRLAEGRPHEWRCRAGSRYLYVDEGGLVHYCSQQRGAPAIPLERYTRDDVDREYLTRKPCTPYCTINCVRQAALFDNWRAPQTLLARLPARAVRPPVSGWAGAATPSEGEAGAG